MDIVFLLFPFLFRKDAIIWTNSTELSIICKVCLGHPLVGVCCCTKKAQESVSVAILLSEASRIAL